MYLSIIPTLILAFILQGQQIKFEQLIGTWQLVHFDAMDEIRNSPQYQNSTASMREGIEYKIQNRLENTVYEFVAGDSLKYTDYVMSEVVQKKATVKINLQDILTIQTGAETKQAKIAAVGENRLVLEPVSKNPSSGKLTFERIE